MVKVCGSARGLEGGRTFPLVGKIRKEEGKGGFERAFEGWRTAGLRRRARVSLRCRCLSVGLCVWVELMGRRAPVWLVHHQTQGERLEEKG